MMETRYYKVAGHMIGVSGEAEVFKLMTNYEPFAIQGDSTCITSLEVDVTKALGLCPLATASYVFIQTYLVNIL